MTALPPRVERNAYGECFFVRPQNPDDHGDWHRVLPLMVPLFVYADERGDDWVRWAMAHEIAAKVGWGDQKCACCDAAAEPGIDESVHLDTLLAEVDWYFEK